jgi:hypothetical protein
MTWTMLGIEAPRDPQTGRGLRIELVSNVPALSFEKDGERTTDDLDILC